MKFHTLTIVGVGLIGGSIGLAARKRGLAQRIIGAGRQSASLEQALAIGAIDEGTLDLAGAVHRAEVAVFCTPVDRIAEQVLSTAPGCAAGTLLTDAGSTKSVIVRQIEAMWHGLETMPQQPEAMWHGQETMPQQGVAFVGSHPLAGSEKRGPQYADADLFEGRLTIVTRTSHTDPAALERTAAFWQALGSRVHVMDPEEHDRALAMTSHLPHLIAAALAGILPPELRDFTATGFRDTTRVAAGDPSIWLGIFRQNRDALLDALRALQDRLSEFEQALLANDGDVLNTLLTQAKEVRDALGS